jgi:hypothetical protein
MGSVPKVLGDDGLVFAGIGRALVDGFTQIHAIVQLQIDRIDPDAPPGDPARTRADAQAFAPTSPRVGLRRNGPGQQATAIPRQGITNNKAVNLISSLYSLDYYRKYIDAGAAEIGKAPGAITETN